LSIVPPGIQDHSYTRHETRRFRIDSATPDFDHILDMLQACQHPGQLLQFLDAHGNQHVGKFASGFQYSRAARQPVLGDDVRNVTQQALSVECFQPDIHLECRTGIEHPLGRYHACRIGTLECGAIDTMHGQATPDRCIGMMSSGGCGLQQRASASGTSPSPGMLTDCRTGTGHGFCIRNECGHGFARSCRALTRSADRHRRGRAQRETRPPWRT